MADPIDEIPNGDEFNEMCDADELLEEDGGAPTNVSSNVAGYTPPIGGSAKRKKHNA